MEISTSYDGPKQQLLFFVAQDIDDGGREKVAQFIEGISEVRKWVIGPPEVVHIEDGSPSGSPGPVTVGGCIELFSALPGTNLPKEIDLQHLEEIEYLVERIAEFSAAHQLVFEFELGQNFVGSVTHGKLDRELREGLIGEWRRHLEGLAG